MKSLQERSDPLDRHPTATLVFAISARVGSGASFVTIGLTEELKAFGYSVVPIKVTSEFLEKDDAWAGYSRGGADSQPVRDEVEKIATQNGLRVAEMSEVAQRIVSLQRKGNAVREKYGFNILAARCIEFISSHMDSNEVLVNRDARIAYIIDSLKHPEEIDLLRTVFGDAFCMVGVVADDSIRMHRLGVQKQITSREFEVISEIDADEKEKSGQHTTDAILESDYFFENNFDKPEKINHECKRLLDLLFQTAIVTPRRDEYGMHLAVMAADKSACLSRQVGAAILSEEGEVFATGCNDVPKFGGGLYTSESKQDKRCFAMSMMCHNDFEKRLMAEGIIKLLKAEGMKGITDEQYGQINHILLEKSRLKLLIEFSRAVHAEMDALMAVARGAVPGLIGSTMYVTTYPCHNCAKHIISAGVKRVVFIEPYVKSLAQRLHPDAINDPLKEAADTKVSFGNYGGVAPKRYAFHFSIHGKRKENSKLIRKSLEKDTLLPLVAQEADAIKSRLDSFATWLGKLKRNEPQANPTDSQVVEIPTIDPADSGPSVAQDVTVVTDSNSESQ